MTAHRAECTPLASSPATPAELEECLALVEAALPEKEERLAIVTAWIAANAKGLPCDLDEPDVDRLASTTSGMTSRHIQSALAMSVVHRKGLTAQVLDDVLAEKVKAVTGMGKSTLVRLFILAFAGANP